MFYGWKLTILCLVGNFILQGSIIFMMNAFIDPLTVERGWTRADINIGLSLSSFLGALSIPVWTYFVQKTSIRFLMTCGAFLGGISFIILALTKSLYLFYIFYSLAWISGQCFGGPIASMLVNNWFVKFRGRAFGLANMGISLSGVVMPFILLIFINQYDVSTAWLGYGIFILAFVPICWFMIRDTPSQLNLFVDNAQVESLNQEIDKKTEKKVYVPWSEVLKSKQAYLLSFLFGLALMVNSAVVSQLKPRMTDLGLESYDAMFFSCLTAVFLVSAKYLWGRAADKYNPISVTRLLLFLNFLSLLLIFLPPTIYTLLFFSFCFGITGGGAWVLMPATTAYCFGQDKFLFYFRLVSTFIILKSFGYAIMAFSDYMTKAYDLAYIIFAFVLLFCFGLSFFLSTQKAQIK